MNCTQIQELAAAHALGALDRAEAAHFQSLVDRDPGIREELESFIAVLHRLAVAFDGVPPPATTRAAVLAQIAKTPQLKPAIPNGSTAQQPFAGFKFLRPAAGSWTEGPVPGARFQVLTTDWRRNQMILFIELDPGTRYPDHTHGAPEDLFILSGDLLMNGRLLKAGDFVHGEPSSHHECVQSPSGCQALLITSATSALGDFAKSRLALAGSKIAGAMGLKRSPN